MSILLGEDEQESESWVLEWLTCSENVFRSMTMHWRPIPTPHQNETVLSWILPT